MKQKFDIGKYLIPVNRPKIFTEDKLNVKKCLDTGWISSSGYFVEKFEKDFSKINKRKYGVSVTNGTSALELALRCLDLKKNEEVIIPSFTIISSLLCIVRLGLKPVLVDSDLKEWNMTLSEITKKITKNTKAIILTHIYGFPIDVDPILKLTKKKKIVVIEDAAEMIGQKYKKKICGSIGKISTFSFYANKNITTGEGGMILTNNKKIYLKAKSLKNLSFGSKDNRFNHLDFGYNMRMTNMQAAVGCGQIKNLKWIVKRKKEIGQIYYKNLGKNKNIYIQPPKNKNGENIYWVVGIILKNHKKDVVMRLLRKNLIETRSFFYPMHMQTIAKKKKLFKKKDRCINSEFLYKNGFYLPSGLGITKREIKVVCIKLLKILN